MHCRTLSYLHFIFFVQWGRKEKKVKERMRRKRKTPSKDGEMGF